MFDSNFPSYWQIVKLKYLGKAGNGLTYSIADLSDEEEGILVLRSSNIQNGKLNFQNNVYVKKGNEKFLVKIGDLIICSRNGSRNLIGKCAFVESEITAYFGAFMLNYRCEKINPKYVYYVFNSDFFKHHIGLFLTTTINQLTLQNFNNLKIPVPLIDEQEKIVRYLDKKTAQISTFVESKKKQVELLDELKRVVISEAVKKNSPHWKKIRLKYLAINVNDKKNYLGGNYVGLENIESGTGKITSVNFENESFVESVLNSFDERFILFAKLRPYLAKVATPNFEGQCSTELLTLLPKENIYKKFLFYVMISQWFIEIVNSSTYGTKMPRANWNFISNIKISVPPIDEQIEIAAYLDERCEKIDKLRAGLQDEIKYVEELKTRIISDVVTGKLDVRELV